MIPRKALLYSIESTITPSQLKDDDLCERYKDINTNELEQWMSERQITAQLPTQEGHFAFNRMIRPPQVLYTQGDIGLLDEPMISIVGPRKMSDYQERVLRDFFLVLQQYHVVTVSGGAPGVDSLAHELSIQSGLPTVMVLGAGFRYYLRSAKRHLVQSVVAAGGLVMSEFRLREKPAPWTFPQRNRIIAGLAEMVFLPGAAHKSGSLITVDFAQKMHVNVYGVTGSMYDEQNAGSNEYIGHGKIMPLLSFEACLDQYFTKKNGSASSVPQDLTEDQQRMVDALVSGEQPVAVLVLACNKDISHVLGVLMELQISGRVVEVRSGVWAVR